MPPPLLLRGTTCVTFTAVIAKTAPALFGVIAGSRRSLDGGVDSCALADTAQPQTRYKAIQLIATWLTGIAARLVVT